MTAEVGPHFFGWSLHELKDDGVVSDKGERYYSGTHGPGTIPVTIWDLLGERKDVYVGKNARCPA
jgi:hypothetical protein